jgi:hypothetical protein
MTTPSSATISAADELSSVGYDWNVFPYLAPRSTASRMVHFSQDVYNISASTHLYNLVDALCGDGGAGTLKKELLFANFEQNLNTIFFRDLDNIFGKIAGFWRYASETYTYDPANQMLTTDEWNEVMTKDAWYRQRIKDFMMALSLGGTPQGFIMMCRAALGVDCELYEVSYYVDSGFYSNVQLGRTNASLRNELVVQPHKSDLSAGDVYKLNGLFEQTRPRDTVVTIDPNGLALHIPIDTQNVAASSTYFQVEKNVTGVPDIAKLPANQQLAQDLQLDPSYLWIQPGVSTPAPYPAWTTSQENSQYYVYSYDNNTAIDTIQYCEDTGDVRKLHFTPFSYYTTNEPASWGPWTPFDLADSPDNYPGGKNGQTPFSAPALNRSGTAYVFPYASQADFIAKQTNSIVALGGQVSGSNYRVPLTKYDDTDRRTWDPTLAVPLAPPTKDSTVQTGWVRRPTTPAAVAQWQRQTWAQGVFVSGGI